MLVIALATSAMLPAVNADAAEDGDSGLGVALFEGKEINLAEGWGEATACLIWNEIDISECFRTEAAMDARIAALEAQQASTGGFGDGVVVASSTCSGYLRLYDGTSYTGAVLYLRDRLQWLNLANWGFNQKTSSYKIGPCSAYFADYANGGGAWYPTYLTEAYDQSPSMLTGWDNDVSSVYIT